MIFINNFKEIKLKFLKIIGRVWAIPSLESGIGPQITSSNFLESRIGLAPPSTDQIGWFTPI